MCRRKKTLYNVGPIIEWSESKLYIMTFVCNLLLSLSSDILHVKFLSIKNVKELCRLGKLLQQATILRNELLSIN